MCRLGNTQPSDCQVYLQALTQHGSCEVMCHELVVDEAHDAVSKEYARKVLTQQHLPD